MTNLAIQTKKISTQPTSYVARINAVLDHIVSDLARSCSLSDLAKLAGLSPFHFHRVFQAMVGEAPNEFVKRLRLERSLYLMSFSKKKSMTTIALDCGFSCASDFTRSFKRRYGVASSKFDIASWHAASGQKIDAVAANSVFRLTKKPSRANPDQFRVRIRDLPARQVAYIRVSNPYHGDAVVQAVWRLMAWADARDLGHGQWIGYQFESPRITELESCYYCVGVEVPAAFKAQGEVGCYRFPAMKVAEVEMQGGIELEIR